MFSNVSIEQRVATARPRACRFLFFYLELILRLEIQCARYLLVMVSFDSRMSPSTRFILWQILLPLRYATSVLCESSRRCQLFSNKNTHEESFGL